jgi:hypothetical protein
MDRQGQKHEDAEEDVGTEVWIVAINGISDWTSRANLGTVDIAMAFGHCEDGWPGSRKTGFEEAVLIRSQTVQEILVVQSEVLGQMISCGHEEVVIFYAEAANSDIPNGRRRDRSTPELMKKGRIKSGKPARKRSKTQRIGNGHTMCSSVKG